MRTFLVGRVEAANPPQINTAEKFSETSELLTAGTEPQGPRRLPESPAAICHFDRSNMMLFVLIQFCLNTFFMCYWVSIRLL